MYRVNSFKQIRKKPRYHRAKRTEYEGLWYASGLEASVAQDLDFRIKAGEIVKWDRQVRLSLDVNGKHICNYYIDFIAYRPDGSREFIEAKGVEQEVWRLKWKLLEALFESDFKQHPDDEMIVIKK